jgi:hypothetical protein
MAGSLARRLGGPGTRRGIRGAGGGARTLDALVRNVYGSALQLLLLARLSDLALVGGKADTWADTSGNGRNATQAADAQRLTYSATGLNSRPALTAAGGQVMSTAAIDLSAFTAIAIHVIFSDSITSNAIVLERSADGAGTAGGFLLVVNNGSAGELRFVSCGNVGATTAAATVGVSMASPAIVTGTCDFALGTNEAELRHAEANVTATRPSNSNNTSNWGNHAIHIGARAGVVAPMTGAIAAVAVAAWATAVPLAQVQAVEDLLATQWGL